MLIASNAARRLQGRAGFTLIELLIVIAVISLLVALLFPTVGMVREAAGRTQCSNNMKQIGVALFSFETDHLHFPGNIRNSVGYRQGWTTWLLPHLEQKNIYDIYNYELGWHSPENTTATRIPLDVFVCPSSPSPRLLDGNPDLADYPASWSSTQHVAATDYSSFIGVPKFLYDAGLTTNYGEGFMAQVKDPRTQPVTRGEIRDGLGKTLVLAESGGRPQIWRSGKKVGKYPDRLLNGGGWARPASDILLKGFGGNDGVNDLPGPRAINATNGHELGSQWTVGRGRPDFEFTGPNGQTVTVAIGTTGTSEVYSFHPGGAHFLYGDGSVHFHDQGMDIQVLANLITIDGGEMQSIP